MTNKLLVVCVCVFFAQSLNLFFSSALTLNAAWIREGFWLNFLSYGFLHGGIWHIVLNMLALYFAGNAIERYNSGGNVLALFLGGTLLGGIVWFACVAAFAVNPATQTLIGASAGIAALFAYFSIAYRDSEIRAMLFFVLPVKMRAWLIFAVFAGISVVGFVFSELPSLREGISESVSVAHSAHLGGLIFGALFALAEERLRERGGNVRYFRR
ncbi:MAG: rhomboid family intramembrane serine protease [Opitutales bacterium]|nr:rhomboid family intramembrane serine protease [Opitutales bacterium]